MQKAKELSGETSEDSKNTSNYFIEEISKRKTKKPLFDWSWQLPYDAGLLYTFTGSKSEK